MTLKAIVVVLPYAMLYVTAGEQEILSVKRSRSSCMIDKSICMIARIFPIHMAPACSFCILQYARYTCKVLCIMPASRLSLTRTLTRISDLGQALWNKRVSYHVRLSACDITAMPATSLQVVVARKVARL